jgi:DNA-binding LacI/PurR family transcriptional regulator
VRQPISEMASQAVTLFSNREAAGDANGSVLDVTLTIRDSVVAPKKK